MNPKDIKIGSEVYLVGDRCSTYKVVSSPDQDGMVELAYKRANSTILDSHHVEDLELIDLEKDQKVAKKIQTRLNSARYAFEKAFFQLQEAAKIADVNEVDIQTFADLKLLSILELEKTIDDNGWRSSSLWC